MKNVKLFNVHLEYKFVVAVAEAPTITEMRDEAIKTVNSLRTDKAFIDEFVSKASLSVSRGYLANTQQIENREYVDITPWGAEPIEGKDMTSRAILMLNEHLDRVRRAEISLKEAKENMLSALGIDYDVAGAPGPKSE